MIKKRVEEESQVKRSLEIDLSVVKALEITTTFEEDIRTPVPEARLEYSRHLSCTVMPTTLLPETTKDTNDVSDISLLSASIKSEALAESQKLKTGSAIMGLSKPMTEVIKSRSEIKFIAKSPKSPKSPTNLKIEKSGEIEKKSKPHLVIRK